MNQNLNDLNIIIDLGWVLYRLNLGIYNEPYEWNLLCEERDNLKFRFLRNLENYNGGNNGN